MDENAYQKNSAAYRLTPGRSVGQKIRGLYPTFDGGLWGAGDGATMTIHSRIADVLDHVQRR
jgi:hypothetical protein